MNKESLKEIGLSEREIKVYIALLKIGRTATGSLVKESGVPASKIYQTLDKLTKKGLASFVIMSKTKHFSASSPENLVDLIKEKEKSIREIIPELKKIEKKSQNKQEAEVYEGIKGLKTAFNLIIENLNKNEEYSVFTLGEELGEERLVRFFNNFHNKRIEKGISVRLIANEKLKKIFLESHLYKKMKLKYTKLNLPTGIFIYKDSIMNVVWGEEPITFVIKSKKNTEKYKAFFNEMWEKLK